ncbi:hypothetical protein BGZ58_002275, partial [Dissophora ornata]
MTLISSPAPLTSLHSYPCFHTQSTEDTYSPLPASGLSWLQPATAPAPTTQASAASSQKYRTLASIQSQTRQQHLYRLNSDAWPASPLSPSIKPNPLDSLSLEHHNQHTHHQTVTPVKSASSITSAIQDMDNSHGTCFLTWIHNPANLDYISLRLRPLCLEYPLVDVANVLRWIGADWSSADCKALFRAVTQSWDQGKRRILAFLLIRDEDMRQKAKSKLVEFAQRTKTKTQQHHRRSLQQQQQQPQPQQGDQSQSRSHHHQTHRQLHHLQSTGASSTPVALPKHSQEPSASQSVDS